MLQLTEEDEPETGDGTGEGNTKPKNQTTAMNKEQLTLSGLARGTSDEQATAALKLMKTKADNAETLQLAAVTRSVSRAIAERKIVASSATTLSTRESSRRGYACRHIQDHAGTDQADRNSQTEQRECPAPARSSKSYKSSAKCPGMNS